MFAKGNIYFICIVFLLSLVVSKDCISAMGYTALIYSILWFLFDRFLWRIAPNKLKIYHIAGNWKGSIHYFFNGKNSTKKAEITIKQTYSSVEILMQTDESRSKSISTCWFFDEKKLFYIYITEPHFKVKLKNPPQYGGAKLTVFPQKDRLKIEYWTSSNTTGWIDLKRIK